MIILTKIHPNFEKEYSNIVTKLNLNISADLLSAKRLEARLKTNEQRNNIKIQRDLTTLLKFPCLIAGGGPSLKQDLTSCMDFNLLKSTTIIAVDGAVKLFYEQGIIPDILVSDLDGDWLSIQWAILNNCKVLIHAHGDNQKLIDDFFKQNEGIENRDNLWGTTQSFFESELLNFGGFTDGDRAIFLAFHFQSPLICLIGFDFGEEIGTYSLSHPTIAKNIPRKMIKFEIALDLLSKYHEMHSGLRYNLTNKGTNIPGFPRIPIPNLVNPISNE